MKKKLAFSTLSDLASRVKDLEEKVKTEAEYLRVLAIDMHECKQCRAWEAEYDLQRNFQLSFLQNYRVSIPRNVKHEIMFQIPRLQKYDTIPNLFITKSFLKYQNKYKKILNEAVFYWMLFHSKEYIKLEQLNALTTDLMETTPDQLAKSQSIKPCLKEVLNICLTRLKKG